MLDTQEDKQKYSPHDDAHDARDARSTSLPINLASAPGSGEVCRSEEDWIPKEGEAALSDAPLMGTVLCEGWVHKRGGVCALSKHQPEIRGTRIWTIGPVAVRHLRVNHSLVCLHPSLKLSHILCLVSVSRLAKPHVSEEVDVTHERRA